MYRLLTQDVPIGLSPRDSKKILLTQSPCRQTIGDDVPSVEDDIGQEEYREVPHLLQLHHEPHVELPAVGDA